MKLIVGLGNMGIKYSKTRHNIGFEVVDYIAQEHGISLSKNKFKAIIGDGKINGESVIIMKPQTYMNLSGEAIAPCMAWHKLTKEDIIIIYDDVSLEVGDVRIKKSGSAGGHNGIKSIIAHVGSQDFPRIKVGVGQKPQGWDLADHVLGKFSFAEQDILKEKFPLINEATESFVTKNIDVTMNNYNSKIRR
ncbi:MAG: aminoacyl-tRNA hydrolase [Epulopiscium sp. Nele67-Bin005]|nr:MAG: aminoacyl-tRNA hydrolase [Epulopiscium sp. Nele67-Bin005]